MAAPEPLFGLHNELCPCVLGIRLVCFSEESGTTIKFADMLETYRNGEFKVIMYHKNALGEPRYNPPSVRFTPFTENLSPKKYLRGLLSGQMHRAKQIYGENEHNSILHALWELIRELKQRLFQC